MSRLRDKLVYFSKLVADYAPPFFMILGIALWMMIVPIFEKMFEDMGCKFILIGGRVF